MGGDAARSSEMQHLQDVVPACVMSPSVSSLLAFHRAASPRIPTLPHKGGKGSARRLHALRFSFMCDSSTFSAAIALEPCLFQCCDPAGMRLGQRLAQLVRR